jgi:hypothetical protein
MEVKATDANTIYYLSNNITKVSCQVTFNQLQTIRLSANIDPKLFYINYDSTL